MTRVVICEDNPLIAMDLQAAIIEAGAEVCGIFATAREALASALQLKPDIAIVDLHLADGATGDQVAAALSQQGSKVVVTSGGERRGKTLFAIEHTFIPKPVPGRVLTDLLRGHCQGGLGQSVPAE